MSQRARRKPTDEILALARMAGARPPAQVHERIVQRALTRASRRASGRGLWWAMPAAAAAAAALLLWVWVGPAGAPSARQRPAAEMPTVAARASSQRARQWRSTTAPIEVSLGAHRLVLSPASRLRRLDADRRHPSLQVDAGKVAFSVHPLRGGRTFRVRTPHLGVEVVGTRFTVEVDGLCSRVEVTQGVVTVTRPQLPAVRVSAGSGRTHCAAPSQPEQLTAGEALVREALVLEERSPERALALLRRYLEQQPEGELVEEALFHAALLTLRGGDPQRARALGRRFCRRFGHTHRARRLRRLLGDAPQKKHTPR